MRSDPATSVRRIEALCCPHQSELFTPGFLFNSYNPDSSVIISTHLIADIESVLDRVLFLKNGSIVLDRTVDEIREGEGKSVDALFREVFRW